MDAHNFDFSEIAPYDEAHFREAIAKMVSEPGFEHAIRWILPDINYDTFIAQLTGCNNKHEFQTRIMANFLNELERRTTAGITASGIEKVNPEMCYTFITNHRDIVLDASFINLIFLRHNMKTSEVAIGDNLLIYEWITHLVKLTGSFIASATFRLVRHLTLPASYRHMSTMQSRKSMKAYGSHSDRDAPRIQVTTLRKAC